MHDGLIRIASSEYIQANIPTEKLQVHEISVLTFLYVYVFKYVFICTNNWLYGIHLYVNNGNNSDGV
jgi:hypothetical protein